MSSIVFCQRCHLRQDLCLCNQAPCLSESSQKLQLLLLTHADEPRKVSNTGRLLEASLPSIELWLWNRTEFEAQWQRFIASSGRVPVLLFPELDTFKEQASGVELIPPETIQSDLLETHIFVLIDATWQQAKKMLRQSPSLRACTRFPLMPTADSRYDLRRNQLSGNLSTVETGCELLRELGLEEDAASIEEYFDRFLRHSEANRSGYALSDGRNHSGSRDVPL